MDFSPGQDSRILVAYNSLRNVYNDVFSWEVSRESGESRPKAMYDDLREKLDNFLEVTPQNIRELPDVKGLLFRAIDSIYEDAFEEKAAAA